MKKFVENLSTSQTVKKPALDEEEEEEEDFDHEIEEEFDEEFDEGEEGEGEDE